MSRCAAIQSAFAIQIAAKASGGKSGVWILGGGSPKNFLLQTEPQIQEVLGISESNVGARLSQAVCYRAPNT